MDRTSVNKMNYRFLGNSGLKVSELCLGCMSFGINNVPACDVSVIVKDFIARGGNFIETSGAEQIIGSFMSEIQRDRVVLAAKAHLDVNDGGTMGGYCRNKLIKSVEETLKTLNTDYIDLFQLNMYDGATPMREILSTIHDIVRSGKVRYIGLGNWASWQIQKACDYAEFHQLEGIISLQSQYNLLSREAEWDLFSVCRDNNLAYLAWSPLKGGWLTGRYKVSSTPTEGRVAWAEKNRFVEQNYSTAKKPQTLPVLTTLKRIATETKHSMAQISIRWCMQRPGVTSTLIGATTFGQHKDNVGALEFKLSPEHMKQLDEASKIPTPYPFNIIRANNVKYGRKRKERLK
mmetsp:Transcript_3838/g.4250  ORF Transcript_3838/g.4250 Transcript_3838/m.4250 type:complete len:347 (+) Transcript_3838:87-1127(+)